MAAKALKAWVVVSDLHVGCQMGLAPDICRMDGGGTYRPNRIQQAIRSYWQEFWSVWVPRFTDGLPYGVVVNGDTVDGKHHNSTHQWSQNIHDQAQAAYEVLAPIREKAEKFVMLRGTEAHDGESGQAVEGLASSLNALPDDAGNFARYDIWLRVGSGLAHFLHHIGTTGSSAYESTAVHKELTESFQESGRWGERPPNMIVRSHRHRYIKTEIASDAGSATAVVTPGWQAKTPFAFRIPGARQSPPQFGGLVIREGADAEGDLYARHKVWTIGRGRVEA